MGESAHPAQSRRFLNNLLDAEDLDEEAWLSLARKLRVSVSMPVFSALIRSLTHIRIGESEAEEIWPAILHHRREVSSRLDRDIGIRVAVFDWFVNIDPRLKNPKVVELAQFERTERSAMTDWLTGLLNRGAFRSSALRELHRAQRYGQKLSLVLLDLDDFKSVNDRCGHEAGDRLLRETARRIRASIRDVDVAARYGGEEFAVLLPETGREGAAAVGERVRCRMKVAFDLKGPTGDPIAITLSGGIAVLPDDAEDLDDLLRRADAALYRAKAGGKNRILAEFHERRSEKRIGVADRPMRLSVGRPGETRRLGSEVKDISRAGFRFGCDERLDVASRVELRLEPAGSTERLVLAGHIVWLSERRDSPSARGFIAGVRFEEASTVNAGAAMEAILSGRCDLSPGGEAA